MSGDPNYPDLSFDPISVPQPSTTGHPPLISTLSPTVTGPSLPPHLSHPRSAWGLVVVSQSYRLSLIQPLVPRLSRSHSDRFSGSTFVPPRLPVSSLVSVLSTLHPRLKIHDSAKDPSLLCLFVKFFRPSFLLLSVPTPTDTCTRTSSVEKPTLVQSHCSATGFSPF